MAGFGLLDAIAIAFFAAAWVGYLLAVEVGPHSRRSLNAVMNTRRERWIMEAVKRENRIIDTQVMSGLQNGTAFFASTSLIAIGGSLTLLQSADRVVQIFADLPFATQTTRTAWEIKVIGLAVIFAYAFFKFGWSYRLFNYCAILIGAIPSHGEADRPETIAAAREAVRMNIVAGLHFNRGQRAFFFALAYLGWFISPWLFLIATAAVLTVMWRRQYVSDSAAAVGAGRHGA